MRFPPALFVAAAIVQFNVCAASAPAPCCQPWDNGSYDGRGAQTSQIGYDEHWQRYERFTFDDFWLCEGSIYKINTIRGTICTDGVVPKGRVIIVKDCNGKPDTSRGGLLAIADSVPIDDPSAPVGYDCRYGTVELFETGQVNADGFRIVNVEASFPKLWLRGGAYWVSFIGYSGTANQFEQYFWAYSGARENGPIKGRPGVFYDSTDGSTTDVDELCCGCNDFAFCILGDECKILLDNGGPDLERAAPSLANPGSTFRDARAADDIVIPNCADRRVCYVEGYIFTNCDPPRARLDIYDNACKLPATFSPPIRFDPKCIEDTGQTVQYDGRTLKVYRVAFWDLRDTVGDPFTLQQNKNYWFSIYAIGSGSQNQRGYFAGALRCDNACKGRTGLFNQAAVSGRGVGLTDSRWIPVSQFLGEPIDLALFVALDNTVERTPAVVVPCPADFDRNGSVGLQDLFDFLAAFFSGCP